MRYARFHPDYGDVEEYFERGGRELGLGAGSEGETGNSTGNTPAPDGEEVAGAESG